MMVTSVDAKTPSSCLEEEEEEEEGEEEGILADVDYGTPLIDHDARLVDAACTVAAPPKLVTQ